jgi:hypothetical protein
VLAAFEFGAQQLGHIGSGEQVAAGLAQSQNWLALRDRDLLQAGGAGRFALFGVATEIYGRLTVMDGVAASGAFAVDGFAVVHGLNVPRSVGQNPSDRNYTDRALL